MSVYPRNLSNFLNRLSGYNKNNVKLNVLGSGNANHGDIIQVELPTNSIVDLSSLAWSFNFATIAQTGNAAAQIVIPTNIEGIIHRLAVEVNGQTLVNMTNYNTIVCGAHDGERDAGRLWHGVLLTQSQERHAPLADVGVGADPRAGTLEQIAFSRTLFP